MTRRWALASGALATLSLTACQSDSLNQVGPNGSSSFDRYVAIGTSVSMGTQSDGVISFTQQASWPAQLAHAAGASFTLPLISALPSGKGIGCPAPIIGPLSLNVRLSGQPVSYAPKDSNVARADSSSCSPLVAGITPPTNNVAIDGAKAYTALYYTPDSAAKVQNPSELDPTKRFGLGRGNGRLYARVLAPGQTQVTAALSQNPTLVSVELGANELLGALSGILVPSSDARTSNGTYVPLSAFSASYDKIIDSVKATGAKALLVAPGVTDVGSFPVVRTGAEIAGRADSLALSFGVIVQPDCAAANAANVIFLPKLLVAISIAQATRAAVPFSCADSPGRPDSVLTAADLVVINGVQKQISDYIKGKATANGFAYAELGSLYNTAKVGLPFSPSRLLTSTQPFGPNISLDGVHPSGAGQRIIARAAADALNSTYGFTISVP